VEPKEISTFIGFNLAKKSPKFPGLLGLGGILINLGEVTTKSLVF